MLSGAGWNRRGNFGDLHICSRGELKISIAQFCASKSLALKSPQFHSLTVPNPGSKVLTLIGFGAENDPFLDATIFEFLQGVLSSIVATIGISGGFHAS